jgi:hypothetical protein
MNYRTFSLLIRTGDTARHIEVVACDLSAARADVEAAYGKVEVIQWSVR